MRCTLKNTLLFAAVVGFVLPASNLWAKGPRGQASGAAGTVGGTLQPPTTGTGGGIIHQPPVALPPGGGIFQPPTTGGGKFPKPPIALPPNGGVIKPPVSIPPVTNPPTNPPTAPPTCPPKGGDHGKGHDHGGSIGISFGFGGGFSDASDGDVEEAAVVDEQPASAAQVVVEAASLPQVSVGATITLHGQGFGQQAGRIAIKAGGLLLPTQVVKWDDSAARIMLPQVGLAGSAKATFLVLRADGSMASEIPFELVAAQSSITQE